MDFDAALAQLEALVATLEREGDERAQLLLQLVDAIHRPAIAQVAAGDLDDPLVHALLAMYGFEAAEPELLAEEALDEVRPYIESHGGEVELLGVEDGVVRVRLQGSCVGCAGSSITLRRGIEDALRRYMPGFREVIAEEGESPAGVAPPIASAASSPNRAAPAASLPMAVRPEFVSVAAEADMSDGELRAVEADGVALLLARIDGEVYALRGGCAVDGLPLEGGRLTPEGVLVCPWHNCAYDVRSGRRVDEEQGRLAVVPVALEGGAVKVAVNVS